MQEQNLKYIIKYHVTENVTSLARTLNIIEELEEKPHDFKDFMLHLYSHRIVCRGHFGISVRELEGLLPT